jgi:hypothetical protein
MIFHHRILFLRIRPINILIFLRGHISLFREGFEAFGRASVAENLPLARGALFW